MPPTHHNAEPLTTAKASKGSLDQNPYQYEHQTSRNVPPNWYWQDTANVLGYISGVGKQFAHTIFSPNFGWTSGFSLRNLDKQCNIDIIPLSEIEYFLGAQASRKCACKFICIPKWSMAKQFNSLFILLRANLFTCKLYSQTEHG